MSYQVLCQACGVEAPSKKIQFHQNIGALIMRFTSSVNGNLCKRCVHQHFWKTTGITAGVGWLGMISLVLAPIFVVHNVVRYLGALGMPPTPADAKIPVLDDRAWQALRPHTDAIFAAINSGQDLSDVARAFAPKASVTPGQVVKFVVAVAQAMQAQHAAPPAQRGFEVVQPPQFAKAIPVDPSPPSGQNPTPPPLPQTMPDEPRLGA